MFSTTLWITFHTCGLFVDNFFYFLVDFFAFPAKSSEFLKRQIQRNPANITNKMFHDKHYSCEPSLSCGIALIMSSTLSGTLFSVLGVTTTSCLSTIPKIILSSELINRTIYFSIPC